MVYDYAEIKMTIPMDYFVDMFAGHYDAEKLDAVYYLENHKWYYMDECWTYDDEVIAMQDYMQDMKDYYISIWKLKTIIEEITGDVISNEYMENVVAFCMTLKFFGIEHINFMFDFEREQEVQNGYLRYKRLFDSSNK